MKKNSFMKSIMSIFALIASIGGIFFLFRDKILACPKIQELLSSKEDCPICSKIKEFSEKEKPDENTLEDEEAFDHAFDVDPTTERGYVSLNINPHRPVVPDEAPQSDLK